MKNIELIDGYLTSTLSKAERKAFNEALDLDPEFVEEFQEVKEIEDGIKSLTRKETKTFLMDIEKDIADRESTLNPSKMQKSIMAAAGFVLIAAFSFFALSGNEEQTPQALYQNNHEAYNNIYGIVRGENQEENTMEAQAFRAYDMGDYNLAANTFAELIEYDRSAINYFYMGLSNLEASNIDKAITNLNATINNFEEFDSQAKWYLALAHLSNEDEDAAVANLVSLTLDNSIYKTKAEALLKEMGLTASSLDGGVVEDVKLRPSDDAPNGSFDTFEGRRQIQFGIAVSLTDGKPYRFLTDQPIRGLHVGSEVEMIIVRRSKKGKAGFAFILGAR